MLIGLDNVHVSKITKDVDGLESYGTPIKLADVMEGSISPQVDSQNVFADDKVKQVIRVKSNIEVTFSFADLDNEKIALLLGKEKDANGVLIDDDKDLANTPEFALMFRSQKANGEYRYMALYKGSFAESEQNFQTKGDGVNYQTASLTGTFIKNADGLWGAKVDSDDAGVAPSTISGWFTSVYEKSDIVTP